MRGSEVFPSKWLKADDLDGDVEVEIKSVEMETLKDPQSGQDQQKPVVYFVGEDKGMVLNVTNWSVLEQTCGSPESDNWVGHKVVLGVSQVEAFGKMTNALRFRVKPKPRTGGKAAFGKVPTSEQEAADARVDDEVPFG